MGTISRGEKGGRRIISLRVKYLMTYLTIAVLAIVVLNTYPVAIARDLVFVSKENTLLPHTQQMAAAVESLERITPENVSLVMAMLETDSLSRVSVMNANMDELYSVVNDVNRYDERELFSLARKALLDSSDEFRVSFSDGAYMSYVCVPIVDGGEVTGAVCVYEYDAGEGAIVLGLRNDLAKISVGIGVVALIFAIILSQTMSYRVTRVLDAIKNVREGEYSYRVGVKGHDELAELAEEFNSLTHRLQRTEETRRRFVADASHELKTPLAAIRLLSDTILETDNMDEATVKEFVSGIREESERLARTTGQLLALTKLDNATAITREIVDVGDVSRKVAGTLDPIAKTAGVELELEIQPDLHIMATPDELFQIIYNLVENAIKYNKDNGKVFIRATRGDETVVVEVEDTGIGIPESDMPYIFDRFYRVEKSRGRDEGGTGLGLSIVRSTAQRHGGEIEARHSPSGGMIFTVTFPYFNADTK